MEKAIEKYNRRIRIGEEYITKYGHNLTNEQKENFANFLNVVDEFCNDFINNHKRALILNLLTIVYPLILTSNPNDDIMDILMKINSDNDFKENGVYISKTIYNVIKANISSLNLVINELSNNDDKL